MVCRIRLQIEAMVSGRLLAFVAAVFGCCLIVVPTAAQKPVAQKKAIVGDSVLRAFESRFRKMDALIAGVRHVRQPLLLYADPFLAGSDSLFSKQAEEEMRAMRRKTGLEITGQAYGRLDGTLGLDDEDAYSRYTGKLQGELGWDFFGSTVLQRKTETERIRLQDQLRRAEAQRATPDEPWEQLAEAITMFYAEETASVLRLRLANTRVLNLAYSYTMQQEKEGSGRMLTAINDVMDIERQLALAGYDITANTEPDTLHLPQATVVSVDSVSLLAGLATANPQLRVLALRADLLDNESRLTNYAQTMRLTPFARVSHYMRDGGAGIGSPSTNVDLGVRFTFPLYSDAAPKKRALAAEKALTKLSLTDLESAAATRCRQLLALNDRLNAAIKAEAQHVRHIEAFIATRREAYRNSPSGYDYTLRLEEYNEYLKTVERLYSLLRQRNDTLLALQKVTRRTDFNTLITETPV